MVRLPPAVPARQEFLGLQSVCEPAESGGAEPRRVTDERMHCQSAVVRASGLAGLLLKPGDCSAKFASGAGFSSPHAGLRSNAAAAIQRQLPSGLFTLPR